jgi:hypothetical protein
MDKNLSQSLFKILGKGIKKKGKQVEEGGRVGRREGIKRIEREKERKGAQVKKSIRMYILDLI